MGKRVKPTTIISASLGIASYLVGRGLDMAGITLSLGWAIVLWVISGILILFAGFVSFKAYIWPFFRNIRIVREKRPQSWLEQELSSDLQRIHQGMRGRATQWDFSNIYNREPYFEIFVELTNTTIFTFYLKGVSGFMKIVGEKCVNSPHVLPRSNIRRDETEVIRLTQSITPETVKLIQEFGNDNKELNFNLGEVILEIENTTESYEKYRPYMTGGEYNIVPKDGLKIEAKIEIDVHKHLVRKIEKQGYFPIDVEFTLRVSSLPIQLATIQLCIADEIIEPVSVSPTIPRTLEAKVESYMVKYEPTYTQVLKGRTAKLTREEELKFLVGQERWKSNKYMAHLLLPLNRHE